MSLLTDFRDEARRRGALAPHEAVTLASAFHVVRDLPYARASDRAPETVLREWRGTCSGKHYLLAALLDALGCEAAVILATHHFTADNTPWLPPHLLDEVRRGPVPDVHTFVRVCSDPVADDWMTVDATWPLSTRALGLPVNATLTPGVDQRVACDIEEIIHVPEDEDPQALKERIIELHVGDQADRRSRFIEALASWLAT
ncbi:MAG: hypothetical protein EXR64_00130 [Dehalococcoidia bacterium]|nr:hypothetical protein [Dehalococcoidia bacterium]